MNTYQNEVLALQEMEPDRVDPRGITTVTTSSQACISAISAMSVVVWDSGITFGCEG